MVQVCSAPFFLVLVLCMNESFDWFTWRQFWSFQPITVIINMCVMMK